MDNLILENDKMLGFVVFFRIDWIELEDFLDYNGKC